MSTTNSSFVIIAFSQYYPPNFVFYSLGHFCDVMKTLLVTMKIKQELNFSTMDSDGTRSRRTAEKEKQRKDTFSSASDIDTVQQTLINNQKPLLIISLGMNIYLTFSLLGKV